MAKRGRPPSRYPIAVRLMHRRTKQRARMLGLPFNLTLDDIQIPAICPVLGIELRRAQFFADANSPAIDRKVPERGYVRGNIQVISFKANAIKGRKDLLGLSYIPDDPTGFYSLKGVTSDEIRKVHEYVAINQLLGDLP